MPDDIPIEDELDELPKPPPGQRPWPRPWMAAFLTTLALVPDATAACNQAGISRNTAYKWRNRDDSEGVQFAEAWEECLERASDALERSAYEWARIGVEVVEVREKVNAAGEVVERVTTTRRERSVGMTIFMLKAWKPDRYRGADRMPEGDPTEYGDLAAIDKRIGELTAELARDGGGSASAAPAE